MQENLLTAKQVAQRFNFHAETVRRLARARKLPSHRIGRIYRFEPVDIRTYLEAQRLEQYIDDEPQGA